MSRPYSILNALPHEAFLNPDDFVTDYDTINPSYAEEQYQTGLKYGREAAYISICANGTWSADMISGGYVSSYEGIGYHAHTRSLLKGFLDSGAEIRVYRREGGCKVIRPKVN